MSTPIPHRDKEARSTGSSEVKTYQLSREDLEALRNKYPSKKDVAELKLTKEQYLAERKAGKSRNQIVKDHKTNPPTLYTHLEKWDIKDLEKEQEALNAIDEVEIANREAALNASAVNGIEAEHQAEIERLKAANTETIALAGQAAEKMREEIDYYRKEIERLRALCDQISKEKSKLAQADPNFLQIDFELHDYGADLASQELKVQEEIRELADEMYRDPIDLPRAMSEFFDVGQALTGIIRARLNELLVEDANPAIKRFFEHHNKLHMEKLRGRLAQ